MDTNAIAGIVGSPPLARELLSVHPAGAFPAGITPARAGITETQPVASDTVRDHPRSCGNYDDYKIYLVQLLGSPPLARELLFPLHVRLCHSGITPARAGITESLVLCQDLAQVKMRNLSLS